MYHSAYVFPHGRTRSGFRLWQQRPFKAASCRDMLSAKRQLKMRPDLRQMKLNHS